MGNLKDYSRKRVRRRQEAGMPTARQAVRRTLAFDLAMLLRKLFPYRSVLFN